MSEWINEMKKTNKVNFAFIDAINKKVLKKKINNKTQYEII